MLSAQLADMDKSHAAARVLLLKKFKKADDQVREIERQLQTCTVCKTCGILGHQGNHYKGKPYDFLFGCRPPADED